MRLLIGIAVHVVLVAGVGAAPLIDGFIGGAEGYLLLTEAGFAQPVAGGAAGSSDLIAESSTFHRWDGIAGVDRPSTDNRGDVINVYVAHDATNLYLGVGGPTAPFNSFGDQSPEVSNDVGDLYIAIDAAGGAPFGSVNAAGGHTSYGTKAVDFDGWTPAYVVGVQFVDNGGGGGGGANVERLSDHSVTGEAQNQSNGGFDWHGTINGSAAYDSHNSNAGEFEFAIPWALLGLPAGGPAPGEPLRINAYTTFNDGSFDTYDSGPGQGNVTSHEELGDSPGDPDTAGQLGAFDPGFFLGSLPGSNFVGDALNGTPGHLDEIDTIEEYLSFVLNPVPEPAAALLVLLGTGLVTLGRHGPRARATLRAKRRT